jgi:4-hydroxy-tetrahydrodipicolinate synthase
MNQSINGTLAPVPTFLNGYHTIINSDNVKVCEILSKSEIGGLFLLGTTGEFPYLSFDQKKEYIEYLSSHLKIDKPVIYCIHHWNTKKSLELTEIALKNGANILSAMVPTYFSISDDNVKNYFISIRKLINEYNSSVPLILYHIPLLPGTLYIKPSIIVELANSQIIQGIKDSVFELQHIQEIIENVTSNFILLSGTETYC